jgi:hypothetical protein
MFFQDVRVYERMEQRTDTPQPASILAMRFFRAIHISFYYYLYIYISISVRVGIYFLLRTFSSKLFCSCGKRHIAKHLLAQHQQPSGSPVGDTLFQFVVHTDTT